MVGYVIGKTDVARRIGGMTPIRFTNSAHSNPSGWIMSAGSRGVTITTGVADPFGGTQAATLTTAYGTQTTGLAGRYGVSYTGGTGGWIVGGVWVKNWTGTATSLQIGFCPEAGGQTFSSSYYNAGELGASSTNWQFIWTAGKVSASTGPSCLNVLTVAGDTPTFYGPVLYTIPTGALGDGEVMEFVNAMNSVDSACPVGAVCNVSGHPLYEALNGSAYPVTGTIATGTAVLGTNSIAPNACATTVSVAAPGVTNLAGWAVNSGGTGYVVGDILTVVQTGGGGGQVEVTAVSSGVIRQLALVSIGSGYALGTGLSTTGGTGTRATVNTIGDNIMVDFNNPPLGVIGFGSGTGGSLTILKWATAGYVNFAECNYSGSTIKPGEMSLNWRVLR